MIETYSKDTLDKARGLLAEMAEIADNKPFGQSHADFVRGMWNAFSKGRVYERFVSDAEAKDEALKIDDLIRCSKALFNG